MIRQGIERFEIHYATSKQGLGEVLMQHKKVVAYASWQLKDYKTRYPIHNMKLIVMVFALKI